MQKAYNEAKAKRENIGLDRMEPRFPIPPIDEEQERLLMGELPHRQQLSGGGARTAGGAGARLHAVSCSGQLVRVGPPRRQQTAELCCVCCRVTASGGQERRGGAQGWRCLCVAHASVPPQCPPISR